MKAILMTKVSLIKVTKGNESILNAYSFHVDIEFVDLHFFLSKELPIIVV